MDPLARPFVRLWDWIAREGGLPGQMFFVILIVVAILGLITWVGSRRA